MANASSVIGPAERGSYCYGGIITPLGLRRDGAGGAPNCLAPTIAPVSASVSLINIAGCGAIFVRKLGEIKRMAAGLADKPPL
jgi:hypothetical protein